MTLNEPFIFGIPLIARAAARDWERVTALLDLTLRSVAAQTDGDFRLLLAAHDRPACWDRFAEDKRFRLLRADWTPERPTARNDDAGCKKWRILEEVRHMGGGLLMYLDADDLVDRELVSAARRFITPSHIGGLVANGLALDCATLRAVSLPHARVFRGRFHEICGSSTIARVDPAAAEPARRDPYEALGSHHQWVEAADTQNLPLARLPVRGAYLVNTAENHSELHGPFADWRRQLNEAVARHGRPADNGLAACFGLTRERLEANTRRCGVSAPLA